MDALIYDSAAICLRRDAWLSVFIEFFSKADKILFMACFCNKFTTYLTRTIDCRYIQFATYQSDVPVSWNIRFYIMISSSMFRPISCLYDSHKVYVFHNFFIIGIVMFLLSFLNCLEFVCWKSALLGNFRVIHFYFCSLCF